MNYSNGEDYYILMSLLGYILYKIVRFHSICIGDEVSNYLAWLEIKGAYIAYIVHNMFILELLV